MVRQSSLPAAKKAPLVWQTRDALIGVGVSVMKSKAKTPTGDQRSTQQSAVSNITNASAAMALDAAADDKHVERGSRTSNTQSPPPSPLSPLYSWHSPSHSHSHSHSQSSAYDSDDISFTSENYLSDRERGKKIKKIPKSSRSVQYPSRGRVRNTPGGVEGSGLYAASASGQDGALSVASSGTQGEESSAVQGSGRSEGYQVGGLSEQQSSSLQPPVTLRVYLEEFRFRPSSIEVRAGTVVEFISNVSVRGERHELECSQEFSSVYLDRASPTYRHAFLRGGYRRVQNQIYTFMTCCITVTESTAAPAVSPQDQYPTLRCPTSTSISSCIPAAGSAAGSRLGTVPQYTAYNPILGRADRRFRAPKLHGSFPSGTKHCGSLQSVTNTTYRDHFKRNSVTSSAALDPEPVLESGSGVSVVLPVDYIPPVGDHSAKSMSMSPFYPPLPASRMRPPTSSSSSSPAAYVPLHGISGEDLMRVSPPAVKNGASHSSTFHPLSHADSSPIESVNGFLPPQEAEAERNASGKWSPTFTSPSVPTYSTITTTTVSTSTSPCVPHTIPETHKKSPYLIRSNDFVIGSISKSVQDLILAELCGELLDIRTQDPSLGGQGADIPSLVSVPVGSQCSPSRLVGSFGLMTTSQRSAVAPTDETKSGAVATHSVRKNANSDVTADASTGDSVFSQAASSETSHECAIAEKRICSASLSGKEYDASIETPLLSDRKAEGLDGDEDGGNDCPDESSRKQRRNKKKNQKKNLKKKSKPLDSCVSEEFVDLERGSAYTDMTSACHPHTDILCGDVEIEVVSVTACLLNPVMEDRIYARDQLDVEHSKSKSYSSDAGGLDKQAPVVGNGEEGEKQEEGEGGSEGESHAAPVSAITDMIKSTYVELQCVDEDNGHSLLSDATTALIQSVQPKAPPKRKKRKKPSNAAAQIKMEMEMHTSVKESALSLISYPSFSPLSFLSSSLSSTTASVLSCPSFPSISPSALPAHDLPLLPATLPPPLYEYESELGSKIPHEMDDKTKKLVEEECDVKDRIADPPSQVQSQATNLTDLLRTQLGLKPASGKGAGFMRKDEKSVSSVSLPTVIAAKEASRDMKEEEVNCKNEEGKTEELRQRAIEDYLSKRECSHRCTPFHSILPSWRFSDDMTYHTMTRHDVLCFQIHLVLPCSTMHIATTPLLT